jgi:hypothetical protein
MKHGLVKMPIHILQYTFFKNLFYISIFVIVEVYYINSKVVVVCACVSVFFVSPKRRRAKLRLKPIKIARAAATRQLSSSLQ